MAILGIRFRSQDELLVLQVHERADHGGMFSGGFEDVWRDAETQDLLEVAAYTRAHDYLDQVIGSLQDQVGRALEQNHQLLDEKMLWTASKVDANGRGNG